MSQEDDAETLVSLGHHLLEQGKHAEAIELFDKAIAADPANQFAWSNKGVALTWLTRLPEASVALDRAGAAGPMNAALHRARGFLAERGRDAKGAVREYSAAIEFDPEDAFSLGHRAQMYASLEDFSAAEAGVEQALARSPGYLDMYWLKAFLAARRGELEAARAVFDNMLANNPDNEFAVQMARNGFRQFGAPERAEALGQDDGPETKYTWFNRAVDRKPDDHEGRLADLQKALDLDPAYAPALLFRAQLRYSKRDNEAALFDIDAAIAANPYDPNAYLLKSNILRDAGRSDEAVAVALVLGERLPKDVFAQVAAAKIYDFFGRKEEALAAIDRALRINPEAYIYLNRAELLPADDYEARLAEVEKALVLDPEHPEAWMTKAELLTRSGKLTEAEKAYDHMIGSMPLLADQALGERGIVRWRMGREDDARADFAAARAKATVPGAFNNLCYNKAVAGIALDLALEECEEAVRLSPDSAAIMDSHATVLLRLGRYQEAKEGFDAVLLKAPTISASHYGRALAQAALGEIDSARLDLAEAQRLSPRIVENLSSRGMPPPEVLTAER